MNLPLNSFLVFAWVNRSECSMPRKKNDCRSAAPQRNPAGRSISPAEFSCPGGVDAAETLAAPSIAMHIQTLLLKKVSLGLIQIFRASIP
jgi:hypothetical protein